MFRLIPKPKTVIEKSGFCPSNCKIDYFTKSHLNNEAYSIEIKEQGISIYSHSSAGKFYAEKTLEQLRIFYPDKLPCCEIADAPDFNHRGYMLDSSRHFISVEEIKRISDVAASLKLNRFHWHLSDDQGYRIESEAFEKLTKVASVRPGDSYRLLPKNNKPYSGYYTKEQIREIVEYCKDRFIEVIPEIDMPGHVSAILHAYPEFHCGNVPVEIKTKEGIFPDIFCAGNPKTYDFIFKLLDEVTELFPYEYFHIGGDEAPKAHWKKCPDCQRKMRNLGIKSENDFQVYFGNTIAHYLNKKGKKVIMWNDILKGNGLDKDVTVQKWMDIKKLTIPQTNAGRKTIISNFKPYYADYPYEMFPLKSVFSFNPLGDKKLTEQGKKSVIGIESPVWLEFINNNKKLEYRIFPRWFAVADTAWSNGAKKDYPEFKQTCTLLCENLKKRGINSASEKQFDPRPMQRLIGTIKFLKKTKD